MEWSKGINASVADMVRGVPPFPFVRQSMERLSDRADIIVVSATPQEALTREWEEHDLTRYVAAICGQEVGTKKESLGAAAKYAPGHTLMIGDAPGDMRPPRPTTPCSSPSTPAMKKAAGSGFSKRVLSGFSPARSPEGTSNSYWPSSTATCRRSRRGPLRCEPPLARRNRSRPTEQKQGGCRYHAREM